MMKQEIVEPKPAEDILQVITEGTASMTGGDFFRSLVRCLALALQVLMDVGLQVEYFLKRRLVTAGQ